MNKEYIIFHIEDLHLATPLLSIEEIVDFPDVEVVPGSKKNFLGISNLRGNIVGVIQIHHESKKDITPQTHKLMVFRTNSWLLGCPVTSLSKVMSIPDEAIQKDPPIKANLSKDFIIGTWLDNGNIVTIVEMKHLLSQEEILDISQLIKCNKEN